jgi:hypothetical protein
MQTLLSRLVALAALLGCSRPADTSPSSSTPSLAAHPTAPAPAAPAATVASPPATARCSTHQVRLHGNCRPPGSVVLEASIGRAKGQVAVSREGMGPMSLAARDDGEIWVLDQENQRLQPFRAGVALDPVPLDLGTYQDVVFLGSDRLVLIDRLVAATLTLIDTQGRVLGKTPVKGTRIPDPALVGYLRARADGVWLEPAAGGTLRVLDVQGKDDPARPQADGVPSWDGKYRFERRAQGRKLEVLIRESGGSSAQRSHEYTLDREISRVDEVESDAAGNLYLSLRHWGKDGPRQRRLLVFDADFALLRNTEVVPEPDAPSADNFRDLEVTPGGAAYLLTASEKGMKIRQY